MSLLTLHMGHCNLKWNDQLKAIYSIFLSNQLSMSVFMSVSIRFCPGMRGAPCTEIDPWIQVSSIIRNAGKRMREEKTYSGRVRGAVLIALGVFSLCMGAAILFLVTDVLLAFALMGLPMFVLGFVELLAGMATFATRLELGRDGLRVNTPQWRATPVPPMTRLDVSWKEIKAVRRRTEVYYVLLGVALPFAVDVYAIETEKGRAVLAGKPIPRVPSAVHEVASRAGLSVQEEALVEASLLRVLLRGPPDWPPVPQDRGV